MIVDVSLVCNKEKKLKTHNIFQPKQPTPQEREQVKKQY